MYLASKPHLDKARLFLCVSWIKYRTFSSSSYGTYHFDSRVFPCLFYVLVGKICRHANGDELTCTSINLIIASFGMDVAVELVRLSWHCNILIRSARLHLWRWTYSDSDSDHFEGMVTLATVSEMTFQVSTRLVTG